MTTSSLRDVSICMFVLSAFWYLPAACSLDRPEGLSLRLLPATFSWNNLAYAEEPPVTAPSALDLGIQLLNEKKPDEALNAFEEAMAQEPQNPLPHYYSGVVYHLKRQPVPALNALNRALQLRPGMPEAIFEIGVILEEMGHLDRARQAYQAVAGAEEESPLVREARERLKGLIPREHYQRAGRFFQEKRYEESLKELEVVLSLTPEDAPSHYAAGMAYLRLGKSKEAVEAFQRATEINPAYTDAFLQLGMIFESQSAYHEAIEAFKKVISLAPGSPGAGEAEKRILEGEKRLGLRRQFEVAAELIRSEKWEEALEGTRAILAVEPQNPNALFNLGLILHSLQKSEEAVDALKKAIEIDPALQKAHYQLGVVYDDMVRYEEAAHAYEQVLTLGGEEETIRKARERLDLLKSLLGTGEMIGEAKELVEKGDIAGAIREVEALLAKRPDDMQLIFTLSKLYLRARRPKDAVATLEKAASISPKNLEIRFFLARVYEMIKEYPRAVEVYRAIASLAGETPLGLEAQKRGKALAVLHHFSQGKRFMERGDYEGALQEVQAVIEINPENPLALFNLGVLYDRLNQPDKGEAPLRQAITLAPDYIPAFLQLGLILEKLRRFAEARDMYEKILEIQKEGRESALARSRITLLEEYQALTDYLQRGIKLIEQEDWEGARKEIEAVLAINPKNYMGYYYLGIILERLNILDEAKGAFKKAKEIKPSFAHAYLRLANLQVMAGEYNKARETLKEVIALGEETPEAEVAITSLKRLRPIQGSFSLTNSFNSNITFRAKPESTVQSSYGLGLSYALIQRKEWNLSIGLSASGNIYYKTQLQGNGYSLSVNGGRQFTQDRSITGSYSYSKSFFEGEPTGVGTRFSIGAQTEPRTIPTSASLGYNFSRSISYRNKASDSEQHSLSASISQKLSIRDSVTGSYGFNVYKNLDPLGSNYANRTNSLSANYSRPLFSQLSGSLGYSISFINYSNPDSTTFFQQLRRSTNQVLNAGISLSFPGDVSFSFAYNFSYAINRTSLPSLSAEERQKLEEILASPIPTVGGNNKYYQHNASISLKVTF